MSLKVFSCNVTVWHGFENGFTSVVIESFVASQVTLGVNIDSVLVADKHDAYALCVVFPLSLDEYSICSLCTQ